MTKRLTLAGKQFGRWTVLDEYHYNQKLGRGGWICLCKCGKKAFVFSNNLVRGTSTSCGCYRKEFVATSKPGKTHGMRRARIYRIWSGAKNRCNNPNNKDYTRYGGAGIKFTWKSFEQFYSDMGTSYAVHVAEHGVKQTTIDRINSKGNYSKQNCRWATYKVQKHA